MSTHLRLALPPLETLAPHSRIAFALIDGRGRVLRSGEQALQHLAGTVPTRRTHAILHPGDAVVTTVDIPPLPSNRLDDAVMARIEPLVLGDVQTLCIAHGPRQADGRMTVVWANRRPLLQAWRYLHEAGLNIRALVPHELALPSGDPQPDVALTLPADSRWLGRLPTWSLARPEWRPDSGARRWSACLRWSMAALMVWMTGLHLYAGQLRDEMQTVQARSELAVRKAFPNMTVVLDPWRQASNEVDSLRRQQGGTTPDDFLPLAMEAAALLHFAAGHVTTLQYRDKQLSLTLADGYSPPADDTTLRQQAASQGLVLNKESGKKNVWHIRRTDGQSTEHLP